MNVFLLKSLISPLKETSRKRQIPSIAFHYIGVCRLRLVTCWVGASRSKMTFFLAARATEADCKSTCRVCGKPRPSGHSSEPSLHCSGFHRRRSYSPCSLKVLSSWHAIRTYGQAACADPHYRNNKDTLTLNK